MLNLRVLNLRLVLLGMFAAVFLIQATVVRASLAELEDEILASNWLSAIEKADGLFENHPVKARVFAARAYLELRDFDKAIELSSSAIRLNRSSRGAHLIHGVALFRQGLFARAQLSVRRALDLSTNDAEKRQAIAILNDIKRVKPWQIGASLSLAPSTNINRATSAGTVTGVFGTGTLSGVVQKSGVGLSYGVTARKTTSASPDHRNTVSFGTSGKIYQDSSLNSSSLWTTFGTEVVRSPSHLYSRAATIKVNRYAQEFTSVDLNLTFANTVFRENQNVVTTSATLQRSIDFDNSTESSYLVAANRSFKMGELVFGGGGYYRFSDAATVGSAGLSAFVQRSLGTAFGWSISARLDVAAARWHEREPLFVASREDLNFTASATMVGSDKTYYGFAPKVTISRSINRSNISIYAYEATNLSIGLENTF